MAERRGVLLGRRILAWTTRGPIPLWYLSAAIVRESKRLESLPASSACGDGSGETTSSPAERGTA